MPHDPIEVWGGVECTVNRVGDQFFNQCERNGHDLRDEDLELFAELGIKKLRQPVIWELAQGENPDGVYDFSWPEKRLQKLAELGIEPIAGLVHHGSGPRTTSLVDPEFPAQLARYARAVAEKFPQLKHYTPINEILTTARFSGLYGVWYPHGTDNFTFIRCLLGEVMGTILAMKEIRKINPEAKLVQTDDLGRAQGTDPVRVQVEFENERRWLGWDLLFGKVDPSHALWDFLLGAGAKREELDWIRENPCPPDIIGVNHYLLSNRFLDHREDLYPPCYRGGRSVVPYADLGITQAYECGITEFKPRYIGPEEILREVIERYPGTEIAVTEAHIDGKREQQMRWLKEVAEAAQKLKDEGHRVVAVTPWSFLGSFDWNSLCRDNRGYYETGVFDIRAGLPRPTGLAKAVHQLAHTGRIDHPALERPGWWRVRGGEADLSSTPKRPILITGATGTLGRAYARVCQERGLEYVLISRAQMDIANREQVRATIENLRPWLVINSAGFVRIDDAEKDPNRAFRENTIGSETLAQECERLGVLYLTFSTDHVFGLVDGLLDNRRPFVETDGVSPLSVYGRSKAEMERRVLNAQPNSLIVRTSSFFGPWDESNFIRQTLIRLRNGEKVKASEDNVMSPTYVPDLAHTSLDLIFDGLTGIVHLSNEGEVSWAEFGRQAARRFDLNPDDILGLKLHDLPLELGYTAPRPQYSALSSHRVKVMPCLEDALERYQYEITQQEEGK